MRQDPIKMLKDYIDFVNILMQVLLGVTVVAVAVMSSRLSCAKVPTTKLNYLVLACSFGIVVVDSLKMPFAADIKYNDSPISTTR